MRGQPWLKRIALAIPIGAVATVVVTWSIALYTQIWGTGSAPDYSVVVFEDPETQRSTLISQTRTIGVLYLTAQPARSLEGGAAPRIVTRPPASSVPQDLRTSELWTAARFGWPFLALEWQRRDSLLSSFASVGPPTPLHFEVRSQRYDLPITPRPAGFAANAALYAAAYIALAAGAHEIRRRRRAGKCLKCSYPLRGLPPNTPCPECGTTPDATE